MEDLEEVFQFCGRRMGNEWRGNLTLKLVETRDVSDVWVWVGWNDFGLVLRRFVKILSEELLGSEG
jgi:hypothetical protein